MYDISVFDFTQEILKMRITKELMPMQMINKEKFINILLDMINKYTTPLKIYTKTKALEKLFELLVEGIFL